jgi:HSP20 family molecular chaperone IbpA
MTRAPLLSSPMLLGFDEIERLIDRVSKTGSDGYPPYNIERIVAAAAAGTAAAAGKTMGPPARVEFLRITLAVAGFLQDQIEITLEDNQLIVRGRQDDDKTRDYIHRGIAARQFSRTFVLADGIEVRSANLAHGLLSIDLARHEPEKVVRRIAIGAEQAPASPAHTCQPTGAAGFQKPRS